MHVHGGVGEATRPCVVGRFVILGEMIFSFLLLSSAGFLHNHHPTPYTTTPTAADFILGPSTLPQGSFEGIASICILWGIIHLLDFLNEAKGHYRRPTASSTFLLSWTLICIDRIANYLVDLEIWIYLSWGFCWFWCEFTHNQLSSLFFDPSSLEFTSTILYAKKARTMSFQKRYR